MYNNNGKFFIKALRHTGWLQRSRIWFSVSELQISFCTSIRFNVSHLIRYTCAFSEYQGPVVQSVVSLMSSLRVISLTVLANSMFNILIFFAEKICWFYFAEKMWVAFAVQCKSYSHFFRKKIQHIWVSLDVNFNESLTNDVVSFEQLGPGLYQSWKTDYCKTVDTGTSNS